MIYRRGIGLEGGGFGAWPSGFRADAHLPPFPSGDAGLGLLFRRTNLPGVAKYDLSTIKVDFPDAGEIPNRVGEFAGAAREVNRVGDDGIQAGGYCCSGSCCRIKGKRISRFGDPVMLDMEYQVVSDNLFS